MANYRPIVDRFFFKGAWLEVRKAHTSDRCVGCSQIGNPYCQDREHIGALGQCSNRRDHRRVIFVKVIK